MVSLPSIILSIIDAGSVEHNAIIIGQKLIRYGCGSVKLKVEVSKIMWVLLEASGLGQDELNYKWEKPVTCMEA